MYSKNAFDNPFGMSPAAQAKRDELIRKWATPITDENIKHVKSENDIREELGLEPLDKNVTYMGLDEFIEALKRFALVKDVYVVDDARIEFGSITFLIKLHNLSDFEPHQLEMGNDRLTKFLMDYKVEDSFKSVVSFQYTEVYE